MKHYPEPCTGAFILNQKGELFLMKSHKWNGLYIVPGGHVEIGESVEESLRREVKEETGLAVYDISFLTIWDFIAEKEFYKEKYMLFLNYLVRTDSDKVSLNEEAEEYVWIKPKDALKLPMSRHTRLTIEKYLLR